MSELLVATRSEGKMREIRRILAAVEGFRVVGLDEVGIAPSPEEEKLEPYETFAENARSKAEHFLARSGLPTVADDSGLEVDALAGAPGVHTKRFAPVEGLEGPALDEANNRYLIERLDGVPEAGRGARYVCVAALARPGLATRLFRGESPGRITTRPAGSGGFGYDPYFLDSELGRTFAEITPEEKNARSHRGKAFRALAEALMGETV